MAYAPLRPRPRSWRSRSLALATVGAMLGVPLLTGCTDNRAGGSATGTDARALTVTATDTQCQVSAPSAPAGKLTFSITNAGSKVNEFYLLGADGQRIVAEVENIGPGLSRDLVLTAGAGHYFTVCKPGMVGDGVRATFQVTAATGAASSAVVDQAQVDAATRRYAAYVQAETKLLVAQTKQFVAAYEGGHDARARALYPLARQHWERIEPVAESFGSLDAKTDLREADLEPGQKWTGWHRLEKDLWAARAKGYSRLDQAGRAAYADDLLANVTTLAARARTLTFSPDQIANGARGLLDEVATKKVTGEEEHWSRTDLWDFQANVDGARVGYQALRPLLAGKDPELDRVIAAKFAALQKLLDQHRTGSGKGFVSYATLRQPQVRDLAAAVDALGEPLSKLAAAVA